MATKEYKVYKVYKKMDSDCYQFLVEVRAGSPRKAVAEAHKEGWIIEAYVPTKVIVVPCDKDNYIYGPYSVDY